MKLYARIEQNRNIIPRGKNGAIFATLGVVIICGIATVNGMQEFPADLGRRIDVSDLPEELRSQLQFARVSELESAIIDVIRDTYDGIANVDEILVGLFRKTGVVHQRQYLANKLYRMASSKQINAVEKKRGVYKTK